MQTMRFIHLHLSFLHCSTFQMQIQIRLETTGIDFECFSHRKIRRCFEHVDCKQRQKLTTTTIIIFAMKAPGSNLSMDIDRWGHAASVLKQNGIAGIIFAACNTSIDWQEEFWNKCLDFYSANKQTNKQTERQTSILSRDCVAAFTAAILQTWPLIGPWLVDELDRRRGMKKKSHCCQLDKINSNDNLCEFDIVVYNCIANYH